MYYVVIFNMYIVSIYSKNAFLPFYFFTFLPLKEKVGNSYCCDDSSQIGEQAASYGVAGIPDAYASEIYCQYIEGGIGRALEDAAQSAHK